MPSPDYWLLKTEPDEFSLDDLRSRGSARWDGVRNYQARNHLRAMRVGDRVIIYHSSCAAPGAVGLASVIRAAYPDPTQFDPASPYLDPKSPPDQPRWSAVDVRFDSAFPRLASLSAMREADLDGLILLQRGTRLSVIPVSVAHARIIAKLGGGSI